MALLHPTDGTQTSFTQSKVASHATKNLLNGTIIKKRLEDAAGPSEIAT